MHVRSAHHATRRSLAAAAAPAKLVVAGGAGVTAKQLAAARAAVAKLPAADRALLAKLGLRVELAPKLSLGDGMLGATNIEMLDGRRWTPTSIRVAGRIHGKGAESLGEVVQHEIGHAISVLRSQDRTEDAAEAYARRF